MVFLILLALLALIGFVAAIVAAVRDSRGRIPVVTDYDTRHPTL